MTYCANFHKWVMDTMSPVERKEVKQKSLKALESLGHKDLKLDEYESAFTLPCSLAPFHNAVVPGQIASEVIHPDDIDVRFTGECIRCYPT